MNPVFVILLFKKDSLFEFSVDNHFSPDPNESIYDLLKVTNTHLHSFSTEFLEVTPKTIRFPWPPELTGIIFDLTGN